MKLSAAILALSAASVAAFSPQQPSIRQQSSGRGDNGAGGGGGGGTPPVDSDGSPPPEGEEEGGTEEDQTEQQEGSSGSGSGNNNNGNRSPQDGSGGGGMSVDDADGNDHEIPWSPQDDQSVCEFTHIIENYSHKRDSGCKKAEYSATTVDDRGNRWRLIVYVNGNGRASNHHLSLFLQVSNAMS